MCGIIGYIGTKLVKDILLDGLTRLEYRGYDSAGIAVLTPSGVEITRTVGKVSALKEAATQAADGHAGIGHTRWATHGGVTVPNAHPHRCGRVTLVHNGIIENFALLRERLARSGRFPLSETDTEIAAMLIDSLYDGDPAGAILGAARMIEGAFALVVLFEDRPERLYAIRRGSPLVALSNEDGAYVASDVTALLDHGRDYFVPPEDVLLVARREGIQLTDRAGNAVRPQMLRADWDYTAAQKAGYPHYMLKEIFEQPQALTRTILPRVREGIIQLEETAPVDGALKGARQLFIVACGTAMHAGLAAKTLMENMLRLPVEVDIASEFRYRDPIADAGTPVVLVSQSGETADTVAALRLARLKGAPVVAVVNVKGSTIARESDAVIYTHAGPEIAVASTKAFTVQLAALYMLTLHMARLRGALDQDRLREHAQALLTAPQLIQEALDRESQVREVADAVHRATDMFYIGRGLDVAMAQEGSLKLKEICYLHSEAYGAGELKHGTISLIEPGVPTFALATQREVYPKTLSNMREVRARGGTVIPIVTDGWEVEPGSYDYLLRVPGEGGLLAVFPLAAILQLLAYHCAVYRGLPVDQPRNLAKSVTVE